MNGKEKAAPHVLQPPDGSASLLSINDLLFDRISLAPLLAFIRIFG